MLCYVKMGFHKIASDLYLTLAICITLGLLIQHAIQIASTKDLVIRVVFTLVSLSLLLGSSSIKYLMYLGWYIMSVLYSAENESSVSEEIPSNSLDGMGLCTKLQGIPHIGQ